MAKLNKEVSEPSILVKPVSRFGGLDNIHIALIVLVIILILLLIVMSFNTKITIINETNTTNSTTSIPIGNATHTPIQVKMQAEKILAGYSSLNSSASILPYISDVNDTNVSYLPQSKQWYVTVPYEIPLSSNTYILGITISDQNLSKFSTFVQQVGTPTLSNNYVISPGVIKLAGQTSCSAGTALQIYWFIDPYAPGSIPSLLNATSLQTKYGSKANLSIKILYTQYSQSIANTYGLNSTDNLGKYILCGSLQSNFTGFVKALNASYSGTYMPEDILQGIASQSGFNNTSFNSCIANSQTAINVQHVQAQRFNVTSPSAVVTDCQYLSLPQTASKAACYANSTLC